MKVGWTVTFIVWVGGSSARAADTAEIESLIRQGVELRQQGRDERALPLFQRAYELAPTPRTAGQLGLAEMATGYWLDAEQHLGTALDGSDHPWVAKNKKVLEEALARVRTNIGELVIDGAPAGAAVTIDRRSMGTLPLPGPIRLAKGKVSVQVSAPGYAGATSSVVVAGGGQQRLTMTLLRMLAPASTAPHAEAAAVRAVPGKNGPPPTVVAAPPAGDDGRLRRRLGWGAAIGAGVALVGAVVETVVWQSKRGKFNDKANGCFEDAPMRGAPGCASFFDSAHTAQTIAIIGYGLAAALGTTSAVLLLTGERSSESRVSRVACAPGFGSSLVSCRLAF